MSGNPAEDEKETSMKIYEIDVHVVNAVHPARGKVFQVDPETDIGLWNRSSRKAENALVTWTFHQLPANLTPVITFDSPEVVASGPTTVLRANPKITFELRFPRSVKVGNRYPVRYRIATLPAETKSDVNPGPVEPSLVIDRSVDPPDGKGLDHGTGSHARS